MLHAEVGFGRRSGARCGGGPRGGSGNLGSSGSRPGRGGGGGGGGGAGGAGGAGGGSSGGRSYDRDERRRWLRGRCGLALRPGEVLGRVAVHGIDGEELREPADRVLEALAALADLRQDAQREDVLGIEREDLLKHLSCRDVLPLVHEAAPVYDVGAHVVGVPLEPGLAQLDGPI